MKSSSAYDPLERLTSLMQGGMDRVNGVIVDRLLSDISLIPEVSNHLISSGGKRLRPLLTIACAEMYGDSENRSYLLAAAVEFIHTATLLHDDVVDESMERRGKASANIVFGNQASILVGDFLFSRAFQLMVEDGSLEILAILSNASAVITQGEVMQLAATGDLASGFDDYEKVIEAKTASLFAAACEIGPVIGGASREAADSMRGFGMNLGMAFQIVDDLLDYGSGSAKLGKKTGDDFREGKMTAPVILALRKADAEERAFWERVIVRGEIVESDLDKARTIMLKHGCFREGMEIARAYARNALANLEAAPSGEIKEVLRDIVNFTVERDH